MTQKWLVNYFETCGQLAPGGELPAGVHRVHQPVRRDHAGHLGGVVQRTQAPEPVLQRTILQVGGDRQRGAGRDPAGGGAQVYHRLLGRSFQRAAVYAVPLTIFGSIQFLGWLGDAIFLGANKPSLRAALILGEQIIRIGLMLLLLERFQVTAVIIAYFVAILARGLASYFVANKFCFPQRFYFWQSLAGAGRSRGRVLPIPELAGEAHLAGG